MVGARLDTDNRLDSADIVARDRDLDTRDRAEVRADLREAYERGRKDERASRRRHPVFMALTFAAALVGVVLLVLAAVNGSFTQAGGVVDETLSVAVNRAEPQVRDAASQAGQSLKDAGQSVKAKAAGEAG
jgi:predicted anti-sigma-YlaC factor YlaD